MDLTENTKPRVLIVDDIPENIKVISNVLYKNGISISIAKNGIQALKIIEKKLPDLILLDIAMPEMNGYQVCEKLKTDPKTSNIPVIFLTAKIDTEDIVKGFDVGAVDYITKPVKSKELLSRVKTHLDLQAKTKQLENLNKHLEDKVRERTMELQKANEHLSKLDMAKNDFLRLINHELRTPLNAIMGFLQVLEMQTQTPEQADFIKIITQSANSLVKLSESALLITSIRSDKYRVSLEKMQLFIALDEIVTSYKKKTEEKHIELINNMSSPDLSVWADKKLFYTCVSLILDNAIRYSPDAGKVFINSYPEGDNISIEILDDGKGFSDGILEYLYDFFVSDDINHYSEGFGLGLATSKLIMDVLDGSIEVTNREEGGANVKLMLKSSTG